MSLFVYLSICRFFRQLLLLMLLTVSVVTTAATSSEPIMVSRFGYLLFICAAVAMRTRAITWVAVITTCNRRGQLKSSNWGCGILDASSVTKQATLALAWKDEKYITRKLGVRSTGSVGWVWDWLTRCRRCCPFLLWKTPSCFSPSSATEPMPVFKIGQNRKR